MNPFSKSTNESNFQIQRHRRHQVEDEGGRRTVSPDLRPADGRRCRRRRPGARLIKYSYLVADENKLERLSLASLYSLEWK